MLLLILLGIRIFIFSLFLLIFKNKFYKQYNVNPIDSFISRIYF